MLKACKYCGRVHDTKNKCRQAIERDEARKQYKAKQSKKYTKQNTDKYRNTQSWRDARARALDRDYKMCRVCFEEGIFNCNNLSVHHIVPLKQDYSRRADLYNLITLCEDHHQLAECGVISVDRLSDMAQTSPSMP